MPPPGGLHPAQRTRGGRNAETEETAHKAIKAMEQSHEDDTRPVLSLDAAFRMQQRPRTKSVCLIIQQRAGHRLDIDVQRERCSAARASLHAPLERLRRRSEFSRGQGDEGEAYTLRMASSSGLPASIDKTATWQSSDAVATRLPAHPSTCTTRN